MMMVYMPDGRSEPLNEIVKGLEDDGIAIATPNEEVMDGLSKYYSSRTVQKIMANRYKDKTNINNYLNTRLSDIVNEGFIAKELPEVLTTSAVINKHIEAGNKILLVTDMDVDGVTSAAIGHKMLADVLEYDNFEVIVNKRVNGNGINDVLTDEIINYCEHDSSVGLMITSDHGSHDRHNLTIVKEKTGIDVIVTDHHLYDDEEAPFNMDGFVNPQRYDTVLKDMTGTGILYFTLLHSKMISGTMTEELLDKAYYLLSYVGMTLISDCMDLKNYINRKIIIKMLNDLNNKSLEHDAFWTYIINKNSSTYVIDEMTLSFNVIPMLNSPGRLGDARYSYELMTAETAYLVKDLYDDMQDINDRRKDKQSKAVVSKKKEEFTDGIIKVMAIEDSDGVQGIIANNIMYDENYKVVIVFTKKKRNDGYVLIGSGRSQEDGFNLGDIVTAVSEKSDIVISHGGHAKAIGVKIEPDLEKFYHLLKEEISKHSVKKKDVIYVEDYIFSTKKVLLTIFDVIGAGPYGIGYESPLFCSDFIIESYRIFKRSKILLSFKVKFNNNSNSTISAFYSLKRSELEYIEEQLKKGTPIRLVYSFNVNSYKNKNKILLQPVKMVFKEPKW